MHDFLSHDLAMLTGLEASEIEATKLDALERRDLVADGFKHPANLAVLSFGQFDE